MTGSRRSVSYFCDHSAWSLFVLVAFLGKFTSHIDKISPGRLRLTRFSAVSVFFYSKKCLER
jgi:hypothetical protein